MKSKMSKNTAKAFDCTYHGWVMIPLDLGDGKMLPYNDQSKMIKIGKKVATSQIVARKEGDKASIVVHPSGVTVTAAHPGSENQTAPAPLLSAAMETISCMLLSKETGIAVVMAFTWDHTGARGVGCDVVKFGGKNPKKQIKAFGVHFSKAMEEQGKANAAMRLPPTDKAPLAPLAPPPSDNNNTEVDEEEGDDICSLPNRRFSEAQFGYTNEVPIKRRRSSAVNETDQGYLALDTVGGTNEGYLSAMQETEEEQGDDDYIMVKNRRSTVWDTEPLNKALPTTITNSAMVAAK